ncbi:MAG: hypothetical protein C4K47_06950 [Candidatus Thorarchaeota archaeon]|nr:MAG: hypothetical protein C4K47_06950 [Candidatus Thorarchaeota archaeon]
MNESSFYVLENSWSTGGAQEFPFGVVVVNGTTIDGVLGDSKVVYIGGSVGTRIIGLSTRQQRSAAREQERLHSLEHRMRTRI